MIERIKDFVRENTDKWLDSPRKSFFGGRSRRAQKFRVALKPSKDKIVFEFESGIILGLDEWRFIKAIEFLKREEGIVEIGARISEDYSKNSLEGYLKDIAKEKSGRTTDTKTAPHIVDLLVLSGVAKLGETISHKGREVQGVKLKS